LVDWGLNGSRMEIEGEARVARGKNSVKIREIIVALFFIELY